jgi:hypothetical protein
MDGSSAQSKQRAGFELLFGYAIVQAQHGKREEIRIDAPDREALLVNWLSELLYRATTRYHAYVCFSNRPLRSSTFRLSATAVSMSLTGSWGRTAIQRTATPSMPVRVRPAPPDLASQGSRALVDAMTFVRRLQVRAWHGAWRFTQLINQVLCIPRSDGANVGSHHEFTGAPSFRNTDREQDS